jgi:hypothetical protein
MLIKVKDMLQYYLFVYRKFKKKWLFLNAKPCISEYFKKNNQKKYKHNLTFLLILT